MSDDVREWQERAAAAEDEVDALREVLGFYADPDCYHAIGFWFDQPTGAFADDFDDGHAGYNRPMPGKRAREVLGWK